MDATLLIPHRPPVQLIDRLLSFDGDSGVVDACLSNGNPFLEGSNVATPLVIEIMAQACAALKGYQDLHGGRPIQKGYLVAIKRASFARSPLTGELLLINVHMAASFGGFTIAQAEVEGERGLVATGELKLWVPDDGSTTGATG